MRSSAILLLVASAILLAQGNATHATSGVSKASADGVTSETRLLRAQGESDNGEERGFFNLKFLDDFLAKRDMKKIKAAMNSELAANKAKEALKNQKDLLNAIKKAEVNGDAMYNKVFPALKEMKVSQNGFRDLLTRAGRSKKDISDGAAVYGNYLTSISSNVRVGG